MTMLKSLRRLGLELERRTRDQGQGLAEYALILALIAIIAIVALIFLGGQVSTIISNVGHSMYPPAPVPGCSPRAASAPSGGADLREADDQRE